ncbi:hypothetical protein C8T65DRAFT_740363 [Cerioporus squamosus]|nr:hypothetical protein C8T65DRAFT_740363 [Cerioporus squamosus]
MLRPFDQVAYEVVSEEEYLRLESLFDAGQYAFKIEERTFSMAEYTAFVTSIEAEVREFRARQARAVAAEEARERELFAEWDRQRREEMEARKSVASDSHPTDADEGESLTSSLTAHVWRIKCAIGDKVTSAEQVLLILEAMKTEVNIEAGEENVGRRVRGFGRDVKEGGAVQAGDVLIYFE